MSQIYLHVSKWKRFEWYSIMCYLQWHCNIHFCTTVHNVQKDVGFESSICCSWWPLLWKKSYLCAWLLWLRWLWVFAEGIDWKRWCVGWGSVLIQCQRSQILRIAQIQKFSLGSGTSCGTHSSSCLMTFLQNGKPKQIVGKQKSHNSFSRTHSELLKNK